jgi:hypothetical protein
VRVIEVEARAGRGGRVGVGVGVGVAQAVRRQVEATMSNPISLQTDKRIVII